MLKNLTVALFAAFTAGAMAADNLEAPPRITQVPAAQQPPAAKSNADAPRTPAGDRSTYNASRLEPSAEDMAKARADREQRGRNNAQPAPYVSEYGTKIEEVHDQNNRVTEIRVTPGTTDIPYTMKNRSDRPIDNRPGADPRSTLDTPKFIEFGW